MHIRNSGTADHRVRGTTLGRDRTTSALVPRSSPSGPFSPTGMAVIGTPLPGAAALAVAAEAGAPAATPDIAGAGTYAGIDPCHTAGTDIAPTNRAVPSPADATPRAPSPPPANGCRSDSMLWALCGASAATLVVLSKSGAGAAAGATAAGPVLWASATMGGISALAGYIPAWATVVKVATGVDVINDVSDETAGESAMNTDCSCEANAVPSEDKPWKNCDARVRGLSPGRPGPPGPRTPRRRPDPRAAG